MCNASFLPGQLMILSTQTVLTVENVPLILANPINVGNMSVIIFLLTDKLCFSSAGPHKLGMLELQCLAE